jgi:membrane-bound inhibitor of C-type lysozyme
MGVWGYGSEEERSGMICKWVKGVFAVGFFLALPGCLSMPGTDSGGHPVRYVCENGKAFAVEFLASPPAARVVLDGSGVRLPQTVAATDAKYTDGQTTLYIEGDRALLETAGQVFGRGCVRR